MAKTLCSLLWIFLIFSTNLSSKTWDYRENPILKVSETINTNLYSLPQSAEISKFMTSNFNWPIKKGFISNRWALQNPEDQNYNYKFLKKSGLGNIDLGQLSPSEKFDLFLGNSNWQFTRYLKGHLKKMKNTSLYLDLAFSETSLNYHDQSPASFNKESKIIPFGSSDFKALLTANYFLNYARKAKFLGEVCLESFSKLDSIKKEISESEINNIINSPRCRGVNPGTFHVMITNYLGLKDQGLSLDLKRDKKLKIRPIIGYISNLGKQKNNLVQVTTYLKYLEPSKPSWVNSTPGARGYFVLKYLLELDRKGNIIGGEWLSVNRPDFLVIPKKLKLKKAFERLNSNITQFKNYKRKSLTQKLIIKDLLYRVSKREKVSKNTLEKLFFEYANTKKEYYKNKRQLKRQLRKINTREIDTEREILLKRLEKHTVKGKLNRIHQVIIEIALMTDGNIFKKFLLIRSQHNKFLGQARNNNEGNDLSTLGKMAFIQKKLVNNYFKKSIDKRVDIDSLYLKYLMEENLYKRKYILTKSEDFLSSSNIFLSGLEEEADFFKLNRQGRVLPKKGVSLDGKLKELEKGEPSSFKKLSQKIILKNKVSNTKAWKDLLKPAPKRTIASIKESSPLEELGYYTNVSLDQEKLKDIYTLNLFKISLALKKEKKGKKLITRKQLIEKIKVDLVEEIKLEKRSQDFDSLLLNSYKERIVFSKEKIFMDPKLEEVRLALFDEYRQSLNNGSKLNKSFHEAIRTGNLKQFNKLKKRNPSLAFKSANGESAIMIATKHGQVTMLKNLIAKNNQMVNLENNHGQNALFLAVINDYKVQEKVRVEMIKSLLKAGINKNVRDRYGKTPKDYLSDSQMIESLIK